MMAKGRVETTLLSLCVRVLQGWSGSSYHGTDISLVYYNLMQVRDSTLTFRIREINAFKLQRQSLYSLLRSRQRRLDGGQ